MKILFFEWGSYTRRDMQDAFARLHMQTRMVFYSFRNQEQDAFFFCRFREYIREDAYEAVFSVNYHPLVAEACAAEHIKYISWSYDEPLNVKCIEKTLGFETNYVFFFDRHQYEKFYGQGFQQVYHLPLAVNTRRLDRLHITPQEKAQYGAEISFVGKLYDSVYPALTEALPGEDKELLQAVINTQLITYDSYLIDEVANDEMVEGLNRFYRKLKQDTEFVLTKEAFAYAMASQVTRTERIVLLNRLSTKHQVKLYSRENNPLLQNVIFCGSAGYLEEMPKVFASSKINLNITFRMIQTGISLRVLDILGAGGFLLTNPQREVCEQFEDGREIVVYHSIDEAVEKADYYLRHEEERKSIAKNGYEKVKAEFTYEKRIEMMFRTAGIL